MLEKATNWPISVNVYTLFIWPIYWSLAQDVSAVYWPCNHYVVIVCHGYLQDVTCLYDNASIMLMLLLC